MTAVGQPRPRAGTALLACWLLGGIAAAYAVAGIAAFFAIPELRWLHAEQAGDDRAGAGAALGAVAFGLVALLAAVALLALAVHDGLRGTRPHRPTWIAVGVTLLATAVVLGGDAYQALPWFHRVITAATWASAAFAGGSAALLGPPAWRRFHRSQRQAGRAPWLPRPPASGAWRGALLAGGAAAVLAAMVVTVLNRPDPPGARLDGRPAGAPAGGEFAAASLGGLCDRIDTTPTGLVDLSAGGAGLFPWTLEHSGDGNQGAGGPRLQSCAFQAESQAYNARLDIQVAIADIPEQLPLLYHALGGDGGAPPPQAAAGGWDQGSIDAATSSAGADVSLTARDGALVLRVRYALNGPAADEDRQRTAVVELADDIRELLR